jgi:ATP-dependent Clp protease ATP-binding subunit ClpC
MFERFTGQVRRVVVLAQEEARMLGYNYVGTEHLLLGLICESDGVAAKALESLEIGLEAVRQQVEEIIGLGQETPAGYIPLTPRAKKALELSLQESLQLGHDHIGTEHILLGLIREDEGVAAQALAKLGVDQDQVREQVCQLLDRELQTQRAAGDTDAYDQIASLRDRERELAEQIHQLKEEIEQLRGLLRQQGSDPEEDTA